MTLFLLIALIYLTFFCICTIISQFSRFTISSVFQNAYLTFMTLNLVTVTLHIKMDTVYFILSHN